MFYTSTISISVKADFKQATMQGQAPDKGLYFPEHIPVITKDFLKSIDSFSKEEIAFQLMSPYIGDSIPEQQLKKIIAETIDFDFPLVHIDENIYTLELFHGPTLAFKDVGARFMSRCLGYFIKDSNEKVTVLVATSGDTGGAVAAGFHNVDGVEVIILYPSAKVSSVQELQLTTLGDNITALEVDGNFDDCQQMVKDAFADKYINEKLKLTSANSINIARWLPQQLYYFFAWQQWHDKDNPPIVSVPSGNFGNICAGLLAQRSGLPVQHFIAACNENDPVSEYMQHGNYSPKPAIPTISNAMDVGNPSNFVRILQLFDFNSKSLKSLMSVASITDEETKLAIAEVYEKNKYLLDPHGAVGYIALKKYLQNNTGKQGFFLETAHPVKFYDVVEPVIKKQIEQPLAIQLLLNKPNKSVKMKSDSKELKRFLLDR
jgi:threonine synthase